jgi:hypothetical protein
MTTRTRAWTAAAIAGVIAGALEEIRARWKHRSSTCTPMSRPAGRSGRGGASTAQSERIPLSAGWRACSRHS